MASCLNILPGCLPFPWAGTQDSAGAQQVWGQGWLQTHQSCCLQLFCGSWCWGIHDAMLCRKAETPLQSSNVASKSTANKLLHRILSWNAGPSWFGEHCSVGNHISWSVTVTGFSKDGQECGNTVRSLEANGCFSAEIYNLIEKKERKRKNFD